MSSLVVIVFPFFCLLVTTVQGFFVIAFAVHPNQYPIILVV